jgi:serine/threonine-protein kinase HipA
MALNVAVHNTDDHLKNFGFVEHVANGRHMLRLSPVFDVVTQASSVHYLSIGSAGRQGTMANVLSQPRLFMLTEKGARQIVDRVVGVVANREAYYVAAGMSGRDIDSVNALIEPIVPRAVQRVGVEADEVESPSPRAAEGRPIVRR